MGKKKLIIAAALIALAVLGAVTGRIIINNTEFFWKLTAERIEENKAEDISFHFDRKSLKRLPFRYFVPEKDGEYSFIISDIDNDPEACLALYVANEDLTDYMILDNYAPGEAEGPPEELGGMTYLQPGEKVYIMVVVISEKEQPGVFDGSFRLQVVRNTDYSKPQKLTPDEDALMTIKADGRGCARFTPEEDGYYRFDTSIVSEDASSGFSSISTIISPDSLRTVITSGITYLEKNKEYYIWVTTHETGDSESEVNLSVRHMALMKAHGVSALEITEDTMIEYLAEDSSNIAVFSDSDGDLSAVIYESQGVPLRTEEDSENSLSANSNDFAVVFRQKESTIYRICVYGDTGSRCRVAIVPYTGDGTSLTIDDVDISALEESEAEAEKEEAVKEEEPGEDTGAADSENDMEEPQSDE